MRRNKTSSKASTATAAGGDRSSVIAQIQLNLSDPCLCNSDTVDLVSAWFCSPTKFQASISGREGQLLEPGSAAPALRIAVSKAKDIGIAASTTSQASYGELSKVTKTKLATLVANTALKTLSGAVRHQAQLLEAENHKEAKDVCTSMECHSSVVVNSGLQNIALCADLAFSFLRMSPSSTNGTESRDLQVGAGILSLIGKCTALKLTGLAFDNIQRLLQETGALASPRSALTKISLYQLGSDIKAMRDLNVIVSCQVFLVRLLHGCILDEKDEVIKALCSAENSNPVNLIKAAIKEGHITVIESLKHLKGLVSHLSCLLTHQNQWNNSSIMTASKENASVATTARQRLHGLLSEAKNLYQSLHKPSVETRRVAQKPSSPKASQTARSHNLHALCRLCVKSLQSGSEEDTIMSGCLLQISALLESCINDDDIDWDECLIEMSTLRRLALQKIKLWKTQSKQTECPEAEGLVKFVLAMPEFCLRYLKADVVAVETTVTSLEVKHRLSMVNRIGRPTIDAVIYLLRLDNGFINCRFDTLPAALSACVTLISLLDSAAADGALSKLDERLQDVHIVLSDALAIASLRYSARCKDSEESINLLRKSVDILLSDPKVDTRTSNLSGKAEKLAGCLSRINRTEESLCYVEISIRSLITEDVLKENIIFPWFAGEVKDRNAVKYTDQMTRLAKIRFRALVSLRQRPYFGQNLTICGLEKNSLKKFLHRCQLFEALILVESNHDTSTDLMDDLVDIINASDSDTDAEEQKLLSTLIVLRMISVHGHRNSSQIYDVCRNQLANAEKSDLAGINAMFRACLACCKLILACISPGPNWQFIQSRLVEFRHALLAQSEMFGHSSAIFDIFMEQLEMLASWLQIHGVHYLRFRCLETLDQLHSRALKTNERSQDLARYRLAEECIRYGWLSRAQVSMRTLRENQNLHENVPFWRTRICILESRCSIAQREFEQAWKTCKAAYNSIQSALDPSFPHPDINDQAFLDHYDVYAQLLGSVTDLILAQTGSVEALQFSRRSTILASRVWNSAQKIISARYRKTVKQKSFPKQENESSVEAQTWSVTRGKFRLSSGDLLLSSAASLFIHCLMRMAKCLANIGQIYEAHYYLNQAKSIVQDLGSLDWIRIISLESARWLRLEKPDYGTIPRTEPLSMESWYDIDLTSIAVKLEYCKASLADQDLKRCKLRLAETSDSLATAHNSWIAHSSITANHGDSNEKNLGTAGCDTSSRARRKGTSHRRLVKSPLIQVQTATDGPKSDHIGDNIGGRGIFDSLRCQLTIMSARVALLSEEPELARKIIDRLIALLPDNLDTSSYYSLEAQLDLYYATDIISSSPVLSALVDGPTFIPYQFEEDTQKVSVPDQKSKSIIMRKVQRAPSTATERNLKTTESALNWLNLASIALKSAVKSTLRSRPTWKAHTLSNNLIQIHEHIAVLHNHLSDGFNGYEAFSITEMGRNSAWQKYSLSVAAERQQQHEHAANFLGSTKEWQVSPLAIKRECYMDFKTHYLDALPSNWLVISISLSEDSTSLRISRLMSMTSPFTISIPLARRGEVEGGDGLTFKEAKAELLDIIKKTNVSTHSAVSNVKKGARSEWWRNRKQLDKRLEQLLEKIDSVWFGGFCGMLKPFFLTDSAFSNFCSGFEKILLNHVFHRQRQVKRNGPKTINMNRQILGLFVALGDPGNDGILDDSILDLLSFVVSGLQLHDGRIAYDEVDFDLLLIDTVEALRKYHRIVDVDLRDRVAEHTILILDKHLHSFPWESLPSMQGSPISRLPSLEALYTILSADDGRYSFNKDDGFIDIDATKGFYVLNPGSDLVNTEKKFKAQLAALPPSWTGLVRKPPTETELADSLEASSLYLYFGHGSGGQYIRNRTVKRLTKCAASLLMGCSSITISEAGQFESSGTPLTYLQAGAPAVLGTLWDVTDKDIDCFSVRVLEDWGLLDKCDENIAAERASRPDPVTLDIAVANARDSCFMRYLNGAAPVIYGIPLALRSIKQLTNRKE